MACCLALSYLLRMVLGVEWTPAYLRRRREPALAPDATAASAAHDTAYAASLGRRAPVALVNQISAPTAPRTNLRPLGPPRWLLVLALIEVASVVLLLMVLGDRLIASTVADTHDGIDHGSLGHAAQPEPQHWWLGSHFAAMVQVELALVLLPLLMVPPSRLLRPHLIADARSVAAPAAAAVVAAATLVVWHLPVMHPASAGEAALRFATLAASGVGLLLVLARPAVSVAVRISALLLVTEVGMLVGVLMLFGATLDAQVAGALMLAVDLLVWGPLLVKLLTLTPAPTPQEATS